MNEIKWQTLGWKITRKLVYYTLLAIIFTITTTAGLSLMNVANTLSFSCGLVLLALTFGGFITALIREMVFYMNLEEKENQTKS